MKRYAKLIGLGVLFIWGSALVSWVPWLNSVSIVTQAIAVIAVGITTASGISVLFYCDSLEQQVTHLHHENSLYKEEALQYRHAAQIAGKASAAAPST